jgi:predicted porin
MKKVFWPALVMVLVAQQSHAADSGEVVLYGLVDAGVSYVSNESGHANFKFDDGIAVPNLLGLRGSEDLGGGAKAIFNLIDQFTVGTGQIVQGSGELFGRNAYVGLTQDNLGTITLGNQYDFMTDALFGTLDDPAGYIGGLYNFRAGPFEKLALPYAPPFSASFDWDRMAGLPVANSVKYASPTIYGFSAGALYGFGNVAGSIGAGNASSFGLTYAGGPFGAAAAYTNVKYIGYGSIRNWGVGAHYAVAQWTASALVTTIRTSPGAAIAQAGAGAQYRPAADWAIGVDYFYMKGNTYLDNNHAHQLSLQVSYLVSKRTTLYVSSVYQRANDGANALINGVLDPNQFPQGTGSASSGPSQLIARVGMQTRF